MHGSQFRFILFNDNCSMVNPNKDSLATFVHGCSTSIDIGYDGVLVALLSNSVWRGVTVESWMRGMFMGRNDDFNQA